MSVASDQRSQEFLKIADQFKLGALVTESSHPVTVNLSEVARRNIAEALDLLFQVDGDVVAKYREFAESGRAHEIKDTLVRALKNGGRIFFTGCGSTGRLSIQLVSIWRDFWQRKGELRADHTSQCGVPCDFEDRAFSVMAGGDYALIKSVEGFEDFAEFGKKQLGDLGVCGKDVVFAITEGGETSFVIGTAWKGVEAGAKVYFVYNNPDEILCRCVERSRKVIEDPRIEKLNLTTGPMAITGSTRMQATTIQLCVLLTVMEMVVWELVNDNIRIKRHLSDTSATLPRAFGNGLARVVTALRKLSFREQLAELVVLEENVYRANRRNNYYAGKLSIEVLTDTTERSPTFCTPPFRKSDDHAASDSWSFLFTPELETSKAWERLLHRRPHCIEWSEAEVRELVGEQNLGTTREVLRRIGPAELMRYRIGQDGLAHRGLGPGDSAVAILSGNEALRLLDSGGFVYERLSEARNSGARVGVIRIGEHFHAGRDFLARWNRECVSVFVPVPGNRFPLQSLTRVALKLVLNALSTCTMVRLGRVMGNYMVWVVPSNLKLIDRATRYVEKLAGLNYERANRLLFEVIEYVEPRMKSDRAYPPVVGMAVLRARHKLTNEEAEEQLLGDKQ